MVVAYLGPPGTFTESAARLIADESDLLSMSDVIEVLRAVEDGSAERGVVPIENTLEGPVSVTLDALAFEVDLLIEAELEIPVELVVALRDGVSLDEVEAIRSHHVALASSRRWIASNLAGVERIVATSTARAAEIVAGSDRLEAAIVNPLAAERYGLEVVARGVADRAGNVTRFVVVGNDLPGPTGWDKTSVVVFIAENRPGALLQLLEIFAERDLNLTKIESRPTKAELGEYCFFVDVEGHLADERVGDALAAVKRTHREVKILGSYRRSGPRRPSEASRIAADDAAYRDAARWLGEWRGRIHG